MLFKIHNYTFSGKAIILNVSGKDVLGWVDTYLPSKKKFIFNARLDYNEIKDLAVEEQLLKIKGLILDSIEGITKRKKIKDSDIDIELLQLAINETFAEYLEGYLELTE